MRVLLPWLTAFAVMASLVGCDGSGSSSNSERSQGLKLGAAVEAAAASGYLALAAALAEMEPADYDELESPPTVTATGDTDSGTIAIDFGGGTVINGITYTGILDITYSKTGSNGTVTVGFNNVEVQSGAIGSAVLTGAVTVSATIGAGTTTGTISGSVDVNGSGGRDTELNLNVSYTVTASTGEIVLNGGVGLDDSVFGEWDAILTGVTATVIGTSRFVDDGIIDLERDDPTINVILDFTGPNSGEVTVDPPGVTSSFSF